MIVVGLTGGIGSGKTTVLKMFQEFGIECYIADIEAKRLMNTSKIIKRKIIQEFGELSYTIEGLNRSYLAKIVFGNPEKLTILNSIVHPQVHRHFKKFANKSQGKYVLYESAILFENNGNKNCNFIITVTAPIDIRIQRILNRDNTTKVDILNRMKNQLNDTEKIEKSDFVIYNIDLKDTRKKVEEIHNKLLLQIN